MSIMQTMARLQDGFFLGKASDAERELVRSIQETGKAGSLVITLTIKPATRGGAMVVRGDIKVKRPADIPMESMMFAGPDGELLTDDPRQERLDLRVVEEDQAPIILKKVAE